MDNVVQLQDQLGEMDRSIIFVKISLVRLTFRCVHTKCLITLGYIGLFYYTIIPKVLQ